MIGIVSDKTFLNHKPGPDHPDCPERLDYVERAIRRMGNECVPITPRPASMDELQRVHTRSYIEQVKHLCEIGGGRLDDADTIVGPGSYDAALLAAGAGPAAVEAILGGKIKKVFCAVRPPGHHAEREKGTGFSIFNNVAVTATYLLEEHGFNRVAVVDFDAHHGNGTQKLFFQNEKVLYCSIHQWPLFPGTGNETERGTGLGEGFTVNSTLIVGAGDDEFQGAFTHKILPAIEEFIPEFILISAGFDAHRDDPLTGLQVTERAFGEATKLLVKAADRYTDGRIVSLLEGGYDLKALENSVLVHLKALNKEL